jgi:O-antigen/teichoic acid export membrane protein
MMRKALILLVCLAALLAGCASAPVDTARPPVAVYYYGPADAQTGVRTALGLAQAAGTLALVSDPAQAQAIVLDGAVPPDAASISARVRDGAGLFLVLGKDTTAEQVSALLGQPVTLAPKDDPLSLVAQKDSAEGVLSDILWSSAPQVLDRFEITGLDAAPLVTGYEDGERVLQKVAVGDGAAYVFTGSLDGANSAFQEWPYFNYLIYNLAARSAGQAPLSFAAYPASPVPHAADRLILISILLLMGITAIVVFVFVRRYSRRHPEALDVMVADRENFEAREAHSDWEDIGFHRPVAGFLFAMMMGLLIFIPLIIYQNLILPTYILPSAQAMGLWGRVTQFFGVAWALFDLGTGMAFVKFFSQYRVHEPRRAVQFGQLYVWWQLLSGAFQVALVVMLAGTAIPHSSYAIYTWLIIAHTFVQIPGFYQAMRLAMYAQQRLDYAQILDNAWALIWPILTQLIFVPIFYFWGKHSPAAGPAVGGALGLAVAAYVTEALNFALGWWLYRRAGYNGRLFFLAHFDLSVIKQAFRFGVLEMSSSLVFAAAQSFEILLTQVRLINYTEVWGNWVLASNFVFAFTVINNLNDGVMPAISEAISNGRRKLSQYYASMNYKWAAFISAFLTAVLLAIADRFILGSAGREFQRAAIYVIPLIIWGSAQHLSYIGDIIALGSNRPGLKLLMLLGEQSLRIVLALLLVDRFQVAGLIAAYLIAVLTRGIAAYFINSRLCFRLRYYPWQSLVAPLLAGAVQYLVLRLVTGLIWQGDQVTSIVIFLIGILFSYPLYTFLYGLFGGWDDATLEEARRASRMLPFLGFMATIFWQATAFGARLSPLHNRFPITNRPDAMEEARTLTAEKVNLASLAGSDGAAGLKLA